MLPASKNARYEACHERGPTVPRIRHKPLSDDAGHSYTIPARYYTDPDIYEREKQAIFARTWHYIGHESHVRDSGDYLTLQIADESVFVMRGDDGRLRGFFNVCRHRAHRLLNGAGNAATIVCPYHAWSYHCDGRLRHARFADRMEGFDPDEFRLPQVRVESLRGLLFVNLDAQAQPLAQIAGGMAADLSVHVPRLADLQPVESFAFDAGGGGWKANWKVVVDNYVECYHCAKAHPALADLMVMNSYRHEVHEHWARQLSPRVRSDNSAYRVEVSDDVQVAAYWYLWPTTSIWLVPRSGQPVRARDDAGRPRDDRLLRAPLRTGQDARPCAHRLPERDPRPGGPEPVRVGAAGAQVAVVQPGALHGRPGAFRHRRTRRSPAPSPRDPCPE